MLGRVLVCPSLEGSVEVVRNPADEGRVPSRCGQLLLLLLLLLLGVLSGRGWGVCIVCWRAGPTYLEKKVSPREWSTSVLCVCLGLRTHPDADMNHDM